MGGGKRYSLSSNQKGEKEVKIGRKKVDEFREGIFALHTRRFGSVAEIMIKKLFEFDYSGTVAYDLFDAAHNARVEVKFSRVMKKNSEKINEDNVLIQCLSASLENRSLQSDKIDDYRFDCNIQQIKRKNFDVLYYGLFFTDCIEIYTIGSEDILSLPGYSDYQHSGNIGEGQFHINNRTISSHRQYRNKTLTYFDLFELLQGD